MRQTFSVSALTRRIKLLLEDNLGQIYLKGEISGLSRPASGHLYFTLKDEKAQISAAIFRNQAQGLKFAPEEGMEVLVSGRVSVYAPRGSYQILVDSLEPIGEGALRLAFEQLKNKLEQRGWFKEEFKKPLPRLPQGIGIVTSPTGAAIQDLLQILERRFSGVPILIAPSLVQGEHAAQMLAHQVTVLDARPEIDLILLARGGGSLEDLWAFNEEVLAQAVHEAKTPIVSAVGHETDFSLTDFVADLRAPTPSAAAELAVPLKEDYFLAMSEAERRMKSALSQRLAMLAERLGQTQKRLKSPQWVIQTHSQRVDELGLRLKRAWEAKANYVRHRFEKSQESLRHQAPVVRVARMGEQLLFTEERLQSIMMRRIGEAGHRLSRLASLLNSLSPLSVLERGYALAQDNAGRLLEKAEQFTLEQPFTLRLKDGEVEATTQRINPLD